MDDEAKLIKVLRSFGATLETADLRHLCTIAADKIEDLRARLDTSPRPSNDLFSATRPETNSRH